MSKKRSTSTKNEAAIEALDIVHKLKYAELRKRGMEIPDIARALKLPEELLREFSREIELRFLASLEWGMEVQCSSLRRVELEAGIADLKRF